MEFLRGPVWVDTPARELWEPKLLAARDAWSQLEALTVSSNLRRSGLFWVTPGELVEMQKSSLANGLSIAILSETKISNESYAASVPESGRPGLKVALVRDPALIPLWYKAIADDDQMAVGELLDYPECCRQFFQKVWVEEGRKDTTISMGSHAGPSEANILLRWMGVRLVPHLPCSGECEATIKTARAYAELGRQCGLTEGVEAAVELLGLPMNYSSLHGMGVLTTEPFRFQFTTDYVSDKVEIERTGETTLSFQHLKDTQPVKTSPVWTDNGFGSKEAMESSHAVVEKAIRGVTEEANPTVVDLGCGDGELLSRFGDGGVGVDIVPGVIQRGHRRHPHLNLVVERIENMAPPNEPYDVVLIMPGRLLEMGAEARARVKRDLPKFGLHVVAYAYGDWLKKHEDLDGLCEQVGMDLLGDTVSSSEAKTEAGEVVVRDPCACCDDPFCSGAGHHHDGATEEAAP